MTAVQNPTKWLLVLLLGLMPMLSHGKRPVQIFYFQADQQTSPSEAYVYDGKSIVAKTTLPHTNFSETFEIRDGDRRLHFLDEKLARGEKVPDDTPTVDIPRKWEKILLVVVKGEDPTVPAQVRAINASDDVFGDGSVCIANLSKITISGTLGDKEIDLKPAALQVVRNPIPKEGTYPAALYATLEEGEKPRRFIKQMWKHDKEERQVLLILPLPAPRHVTYYSAPVKGL